MAGFDVDADLVRKLAELLEETGLSEVEFESGGQRIRVSRNAAAAATAAFAPLPAAAGPPPPDAGASADALPVGAVTSPMVGTAYVAPEPGAAPYVKVGDRVAEGDTLLVVEAMKVMNPIAAPHGGMVVEVLVSDGRPVEYGQVLMVVR
ncbi:MAG TPA: acetyl-CoA carboxylase biotin carboxyl carrier protein [Dongiaceae bacterium]|nr:acetyl-CoA carboxylase biotin carboxyl carrier protein [Dongiaceae bacterium]